MESVLHCLEGFSCAQGNIQTWDLVPVRWAHCALSRPWLCSPMLHSSFPSVLGSLDWWQGRVCSPSTARPGQGERWGSLARYFQAWHWPGGLRLGALGRDLIERHKESHGVGRGRNLHCSVYVLKMVKPLLVSAQMARSMSGVQSPEEFIIAI